MKKIILGLICIMCSGCALTTMVGDVTAYTPNGEILQKWEQVILQETVSFGFIGKYTIYNAFKAYGINFYDEKNGKYIIVGDSVPCIIEYGESSYNSPNTNYISDDNKQVDGAKISSEQYKNELIEQWKTLSTEEHAIKSLMKETSKNSVAYKNLKKQRKVLMVGK